MNSIEKDAQYIWHPLTQYKTASAPLIIKKAKGVYLYDEQNNKYIDAISSWYCAMYGHCNTYITKKVSKQLQELTHVMFAGFSHSPAIELAEKIISITPESLQKVFFSENGSTSVDIAIKMALQYYFNQGIKRDTIISFKNAFHGDTFGAMSVSGLDVYNGPFSDFKLKVIQIDVPSSNTIAEIKIQLKKIIKDHKIAGFIYEPLIQGAIGMHFYKSEHLNELLKITKTNDILNIADEVMTGLGKTETLFASDQIETKPDILCLSKSLSAGIVPMALTLCSTKIFNAFYDDNLTKGFFHAHTYSGNPVACSTALAGLDLLLSPEYYTHRDRINQQHLIFLNRLKENSKVKNARVKGLILAFELNTELDRYGTIRNKMYQFALKKGVCLRPLGNTIYTLPPFITSNEELKHIYDCMWSIIEKYV